MAHGLFEGNAPDSFGGTLVLIRTEDCLWPGITVENVSEGDDQTQNVQLLQDTLSTSRGRHRGVMTHAVKPQDVLPFETYLGLAAEGLSLARMKDWEGGMTIAFDCYLFSDCMSDLWSYDDRKV